MQVLLDGIYKYRNKYVRIYYDEGTYAAYYREVVAGKRNRFIFKTQTKRWMGWFGIEEIQTLYYGPNDVAYNKISKVLLKIRLMDQRFKDKTLGMAA